MHIICKPSKAGEGDEIVMIRQDSLVLCELVLFDLVEPGGTKIYSLEL